MASWIQTQVVKLVEETFPNLWICFGKMSISYVEMRRFPLLADHSFSKAHVNSNSNITVGLILLPLP